MSEAFAETASSSRRSRFTAFRWIPGLLLLLGALGSQIGNAGTAAVAMPDQYSAAVSAQVLSEGGNAIDASVAAAFVLAVTYPEAGNIGGGGFLLAYMDRKPAFLDFRERAPLASHRDMYLDEEGNFVQQSALTGGKASGVPGTVRGLWAAHARYGSVPWSELIQPAISLARDGFVIHADLAGLAEEKITELKGRSNFTGYFEGMRGGERFKQPELAKSLGRIARDPDDYYTGLIARQIVAQMESSGGTWSRAMPCICIVW